MNAKSDAVENGKCVDCEILQRKLDAARNRIADDCDSAEKHLASLVVERQQVQRRIFVYRLTLAVVLLVVALLLTGCGAMTNDQIIAEHNKCKAAGMDAIQTTNGLTMRTYFVTCVPKEKAK